MRSITLGALYTANPLTPRTRNRVLLPALSNLSCHPGRTEAPSQTCRSILEKFTTTGLRRLFMRCGGLTEPREKIPEKKPIGGTITRAASTRVFLSRFDLAADLYGGFIRPPHLSSSPL
jgi:hypothetical protein